MARLDGDNCRDVQHGSTQPRVRPWRRDEDSDSDFGGRVSGVLGLVVVAICEGLSRVGIPAIVCAYMAGISKVVAGLGRHALRVVRNERRVAPNFCV